MTHPIWFYHLRRSNLLIDYRANRCQDACCKLLNLNPKKVVWEQDTRYRTPQMTPRLFGKLLTFLVSLGNSLLPTKLHTVSILTFSMRVWSKLRQRTSWCTWEMSNLIRVHWPNIEGLANWLSTSRPTQNFQRRKGIVGLKGALMDYELTCCITRAEEACASVYEACNISQPIKGK